MLVAGRVRESESRRDAVNAFAQGHVPARHSLGQPESSVGPVLAPCSHRHARSGTLVFPARWPPSRSVRSYNMAETRLRVLTLNCW